MTRESRVYELVAQWEELRAAGQSPSLEALCRDCADLIPFVEDGIRQLYGTTILKSEADAFAPPPFTKLDTRSGDAASTNLPDGARSRPARSSDESYPVVPGYELLGVVGHGGMGIVYHAVQSKLNRPVALKMILDGRRVTPNTRIRFLAEAEAVASINHPNVVKVFDFGENDGAPFMALEFCEGGSLTKRLRPDPLGPAATCLPAVPAAALIGKIARGVAAAHAVGIVHRDLKPENILFDRHGEPKVADFGLAKKTDGSDLTRTHAILGTPAYMAPEQARGGAKFVGPSADVHALGAILYQCLAGRLPFPLNEDPLEMLRRIADDPPTRLRSLVPALPRDLDIICQKCLAKDARDRYPTAAELADDLDRFVAGEPVAARPTSPVVVAYKWAKRKPLLAGLVSSLAVVLLGLVGSLFVQYRAALELAKQESVSRAIDNARRERVEELLRNEKDANQRAQDEARRANQQQEIADAQRSFFSGLFRASDPLGIIGSGIQGGSDQDRHLTAEQLIKRGEEKARREWAHKPELRAALFADIGDVYRNMGLFDRSKALLDEAFDIQTKLLPPDDPRLAKTQFYLAWWLQDQGDYFRALAGYDRALAVQSKVLPEDADETLATMLQIGWVRGMLGDPSAQAIIQKVVTARARKYGDINQDTAIAYAGLAAIQLENGDDFAALANMAKLVALIEKSGPEANTNLVALLLFQEGMTLKMGGKRTQLPRAEQKLRECLAIAEKNLGAVSIYAAFITHELASTIHTIDERRWAEAEVLYLRCLDTARKTVGMSHPKVSFPVSHYADLLAKRGRVDEGRALHQEMGDAQAAKFGRDSPLRLEPLCHWCRFEAEWGDRDIAESLAADALAALPNSLLSAHRRGLFLGRAGLELCQNARSKAGEACVRAAMAELARAPAKDAANTLLVFQGDFAKYLIGRSEWAEAGELLAVADTAARAAKIMASADGAFLLYQRADLALATGDLVAAEKYADEAVRIATKADTAAFLKRDLFFARAGLHAAKGEYAEAAKLLDVAAANAATVTRRVGASYAIERNTSSAERALVLGARAVMESLAGNPVGARKSVEALTTQCADSISGLAQARLAVAAGCVPGENGWAAEWSVHILRDLAKGESTDPRVLRGLAVALLRAGYADEAEAAVNRIATPSRLPTDGLIGGLAAAARKDVPRARAALNAAAAAPPSPGGTHRWLVNAQVELLTRELRAALAAEP